MSPDDYRREHDLVVQGQAVPEPIQSFDAAGFTAGIMDEVHHPAQAGPILFTPFLHANSWLHERCTASASHAAARIFLRESPVV